MDEHFVRSLKVFIFQDISAFIGSLAAILVFLLAWRFAIFVLNRKAEKDTGE